MTAYMIGSRCFEIGQARSPRAGTDTVALAVKAGDGTPAGQPALSFAGLLRRLRAEARLTQEELAEAAGLSPRSISDLERGVNLTARKDTALLLADALGMTGQVRVLFVAAARGRAPASEVLEARNGPPADAQAAAGALPRDTAGFTGLEPALAQLIEAVAGTASTGGRVVGIYVIGMLTGPIHTARTPNPGIDAQRCRRRSHQPQRRAAVSWPTSRVVRT